MEQLERDFPLLQLVVVVAVKSLVMDYFPWVVGAVVVVGSWEQTHVQWLPIGWG